jgi:hypothetical protein
MSTIDALNATEKTNVMIPCAYGYETIRDQMYQHQTLKPPGWIKGTYQHCWFQFCNLKNMQTRNTWFRDCLFRHSCLERSVFDQSSFYRSQFVHCTMDHVRFERFGNVMRECFINDSTMRNITADHLRLDHTFVMKSTLDHARISKMELIGSTLVASSFCHAVIDHLTVRNTQIDQCDFTQTQIGTLCASPWNRLYLAYRGAYWKEEAFTPRNSLYE